MALVVENGSCVPTANAFVTRQELIDYAADYLPGTTVPDDTTTDGAILRGSSWLSAFPDWDGQQTCGRGNQGLAWPRTGVTDCAGDTVPDDEVPIEVKQAAYAAALAELSSPGILTPTITPGQQAKREKVDVIEVEYMTPKDQGVPDGTYDPADSLRPLLTQVQDLIKCMASIPGTAAIPWPWVA